MKLVPKGSPDISVILGLAILGNDEGALLCGEGGVLAEGDLWLARRCHPGLNDRTLKLEYKHFQHEISKCLYLRIIFISRFWSFHEFKTNFKILKIWQL